MTENMAAEFLLCCAANDGFPADRTGGSNKKRTLTACLNVAVNGQSFLVIDGYLLNSFGLFEANSLLNLRTSEIHLFYNLQLFYWHFLEILWLFIFQVFYNLFLFILEVFSFPIFISSGSCLF